MVAQINTTNDIIFTVSGTLIEVQVTKALKENDLILQEAIVTAKRLDAYEIDLDKRQNAEMDALRKAVQTEYILKMAIEECTDSIDGSRSAIENSIAINLKLYNADTNIDIYESAITQNLYAKTTL